MRNTEPRFDAYIEKSHEFAQPILKHFRRLVHTACPDVEEKIKWGMPHFDYHGGPLCHMAAFKNHCAFGFWKASLMDDPDGILQTSEREAMGHFGKIAGMDELPSDEIILKYITEAMRLNESGVKVAKKPVVKKELVVPEYFTDVLKTNDAAAENFENFSPSCKKEYVEWITEAKTEATREKRMTQALEWISEGKQRHWKYEKSAKV
jgi:uncharacterized protein YdeI (YjbR/CyaY-like superfamily)